MKGFYKIVFITSLLIAGQNAAAAMTATEGICKAQFTVDGTNYLHEVLVQAEGAREIMTVKQLKPHTHSTSIYEMAPSGDLKMIKKGSRQIHWSSYRPVGSQSQTNLVLTLEDGRKARCN